MYRKGGEEATEKELAQTLNMNSLQPLNAKKLTEEEKRKAIASLIFLNEKRGGTIKARQCIDGRKQQEYMMKEESASPTEMIFITSIINAKENRQVAVGDLPGAFLHAENEDVIMFMRGRLAVLMTVVLNKHTKNI